MCLFQFCVTVLFHCNVKKIPCSNIKHQDSQRVTIEMYGKPCVIILKIIHRLVKANYKCSRLNIFLIKYIYLFVFFMILE